MNEWLAISCAGGIGGFASTLLPPGTDVPWPSPIQDFVDRHGYLGLAFHLFRNIVFGALAGFVVWALAAPSGSFSSSNVTVGQVAAAVIIGGGGVSLVNRLFQQSARLDVDNQAIAAAQSLLNADAGDEDG